MPLVDTVLFDWDDTLIDSIPARVKALENVFQTAGINGQNPEEFFISLKGTSFQQSLDQLARARGIKDDLFALYRRTYWFEVKGADTLYPGIKEMLDKLKKDGYRLGIVTNKFRDSVFEGGQTGCVIELRRTQIMEYFSVIVGLEDVKEQKPHPEGVSLALSHLNVKPEQVLVVGDSDADMGAGKAAGCLTCRASWCGGDGLDGGGSDFTAEKPEEVVTILKRLVKKLPDSLDGRYIIKHNLHTGTEK
jgi:pyrophosphatase PpaX